jgi:hypothetical protein
MDYAKNILEGSVCYLAGPIDEAIDSGFGYRRKIISGCLDRNINIQFLDPTNKLEGLKSEVGTEQNKIRRLRAAGRWKELSETMKSIVRIDLRQVDISDFIIVKIDKSIHMCGTYHELVVADIEKKPILTIIEGGKTKAPAWLFGILDHKYMFDSEEDCLKYLEKVNNNEVELSDRWVLFRKQLQESYK